MGICADVRPVVAWKSPTITPDVPKGEAKAFWVAVKYKRKEGWDIVAYVAQYVNKPLEYADDDLYKERPLDDAHFVDCDGYPIAVVGWYGLTSYCEPEDFDDKRVLLGWGEYLKPAWV